MKTLFLAISSSYVHTLLSPRYLAANSPLPVEIYETNVNVDPEETLAFVLRKKPDVIACACYIFNVSYVIALLKKIRQNLPDVRIVLGGYEAVYGSDELLSLCDHLIKGEGDFSFGKLLERINDNDVSIPKVVESGTVKNLDEIVSPYTDEYLSFGKQHKILYMETCRGCPFGCAYCMSANTHGVRSFSLKRVFEDFDRIMAYAPPLVKLVDRTFNYDKRRAEAIFAYLIEKYGQSGTRFHFEMAPELFDDALFGTLEKAPKGLFQFEIGVQSYKDETLDAVARKADAERVDETIKRLVGVGNIPVHVDLIAGLPLETKEDFRRGFDRLIGLFPDCLQLGFLKILKGSRIADDRDGYATEEEPPYEIVRTPWMTEEDLAELKRVEKFLNTYYNSGRFPKSMRFLLGQREAYATFLDLAAEFEKSGLSRESFSAPRQCDLLFLYGKNVLSAENAAILERLIYDDYASCGNVRRWHKWLKNGKIS